MIELSGTYCGGLSSDAGSEALVLAVSKAESTRSLESREIVQGSLFAPHRHLHASALPQDWIGRLQLIVLTG